MGGLRALLVRRSETDHSAGANQRWPFCFRDCCINGLLNFNGIMPVNPPDHLPAISFKSGRGVVGKPTLYFTIDGNAVVIPKCSQFTESELSGQGTGFMRNTFHQAAVSHKDPGPMINDFMVSTIKAFRKNLLSQCHAHSIRYSLTQGAGGGFHTSGFAVLRMAGGLRV